MGFGPRFDPNTVLLGDASISPATASLEVFDAKIAELKRSRAADSIDPLGSFEYPYPSDEGLLDILRARIRSHVFKYVPWRVIKLPEMQFMERTTVVQFVNKQKLNNAVEDIRRREREICGVPHAWATERGFILNKWREQAISEFIDDVTKFAILSHTWGEDEPTYDDFSQQRNLNGQGYDKLKRFCEIAYEQYGAEFAWADTVCIDKSSSAELDEAIRSMFAWYRSAGICIAYVAQTPSLVDLPADPWFTRGWTLQELLAPRRIKFYSKDWHLLTNFKNDKVLEEDVRKLNSKDHSLQLQLLQNAISAATGVDMDHIRNFRPGIHDPPVPERMKWMSRRVTTRGEDRSYSLMGIFGVSISIAYGEGPERAFFRLFQALLEVGCSLDWFLWIGNPVPSYIHPSNLVPSSPECYLSWEPKYAREGVRSLEDEPVSLTNAGLPMNMLIIPAKVTHPDIIHIGLMNRRPGDSCITCPISDETVVISPVLHDYKEVSNVEFALGAFRVPSDDTPTPEHVYAILLRRTAGEQPFSPRNSWFCSKWQKCEASKTIVFRCNERFRGMKFKDWTEVKLSRSEVGWVDDEKGIADTPRISVQTLYL